MIDGYNLLHAAGLCLARYAPGDLNRQRHRLIVRLAGLLTAAERLRCVVVFDAKDAPTGLDRQYRRAEITIQFADPGHDADTLIEDLIIAHPSPTQLLVVSSDHRLQKAAKQSRAESIGSDEFLSAMTARARAAEDVKPPLAGPPAAKSTPTPDDVSYWMREFGEIDLDAIAAQDEPASNGPADAWQKQLDDLQRQLDEGQDLDDWLNGRPRPR